MLGARQVDLAALYREVGRRGGAGAVTERKLWKAVARALGLEESAKAAATLRSTFDAFLGSYARRCAASKWVRVEGDFLPLNLLTLNIQEVWNGFLL